MKVLRRLFIALAVIATLAVLTWLGTFIWLLSSNDMLNHPLAKIGIYPIACTTRGCVTSKHVFDHHTQALVFSAASLIEAPSFEKSFTTVIRRHLVSNAFIQSPVTAANAMRYREEILHITTEEQLRKTIDMSLNQYDRYIIIPFLQQEALRAQHSVESTEELYGVLSSQRYVVVLPFQYGWDRVVGQVIGE